MTVIWALFVLSITQSVASFVTGPLHKSHKDGPPRCENGQSVHKDDSSIQEDGPPVHKDGPPLDEDDSPRQEDGPSGQEHGSTLLPPARHNVAATDSSKKNHSLEFLVESSKSLKNSTNTETHIVSTSSKPLSNLTNTTRKNVSTALNLLSNLTKATTNNARASYKQLNNLTNTATNNRRTSSKLLSNLTNDTTKNISTSSNLSNLKNWPTNLPGIDSGNFSCRRSCGIVREMPCSCDIKCLVLRTCCEDMAAECPDVVMETRQTYGHMLGAGTTCSNHLGFGYFLITTCPMHNSTSIYQKLENAENKDDTWEPGIFSSSQQSDKLVEIFNNVPIADKATNFDYVNLSIFECNAMNGSVPVSWEVMFSVDIYIGAPLNGAYLSQNVLNNDQRLYILPIELVETMSRSKCYAPSISSCINKFTNKTEKFADKCRQFYSFVFFDYFYNNKYCAICNGVNETKLTLFIDPESDPKRHGNEFSVLASFEGQGFKLTPLGQLFSWETSECTAKGPKVDPTFLDNFSCQMEKCKPGFEKMPNGLCVKKNGMQVAVEDNGFPLSVIEQRQLPKFLECYLKAHASFHGLHAESLVQIRFADRLNQVMYNTVMSYFDTALNKKDFQFEMSAFESMIKVLTLHRLHQNKKLYATHTNRNESVPLALLNVDSIDAEPCTQVNHTSKTINSTYCISRCLNLTDCAYTCYIVCVEVSHINANHTTTRHNDTHHTTTHHTTTHHTTTHHTTTHQTTTSRTEKSRSDKGDVGNICFHLLNSQSRSVWPSILFVWTIALNNFLAVNTI